MTTRFDGYVLSGARSATSNAMTTSPADSGVSRSTRALPSGYPSGQPVVVESRASQYRASHTGSESEYLLWAANTSSLAIVEDSSWEISEGTVSIPSGGITVNDPSSPTGTRTDGTTTVVLVDNQTRSIAGLTTLTYRRGGTTTDVSFVVGVDVVFNPVSGVIEIQNTATTRSATNTPIPEPPAASAIRGDRLTASYYLSAAKFWWTKNDSSRTRFTYNGATSKWEPCKGGPVLNLGELSPTGSYVLAPVPNLPVGSYIPGSTSGTEFAALRIGATPSEASYPVAQSSLETFTGVLVVTDDLANGDYDFNSNSPPLAGVVGTSGTLVWNPDFVAVREGVDVWYSPETLTVGGNGVVGKLIDNPLYISPLPRVGERPIIRIGNRQPLTVLLVRNETELAGLSVASGYVGIALSTGRLRFNTADVSKADPGTRTAPNAGFDPLWLGAEVIYGGTTGNLYPLPTKPPTPLVNLAGTAVTYNGGDLFIPDGTDLPGLGTSGIISVPDGSGSVPNAGTVYPRPGASGLVRKLSSGVGDVVIFAATGAATRIVTVDFEDELPTDPYSIPAETAYVALKKRSPSSGSRVVFSADLIEKFTGQYVYFLQTEVILSEYASNISLVSSFHGSTLTLDGTESLTFRLGSTDITWSAATDLGAGTFFLNEIATSLNLALAGAPGYASTFNDQLVLTGDTHVSIGFGEGGELNLSGCQALGFVPGSFASAGDDGSATDTNWNSVRGLAFGVYRSGRNLDGLQEIPDFRDLYRLTDRVLTDSIAATPYQFLDYAPREDIAGYNLGVYFLLSGSGGAGGAPKIRSALNPFRDVLYDFGAKRISFLGSEEFVGNVESPISSVDLGQAGVVSESFYSALNGYLKVSRLGGAYTYLELGTDFVIEGSSAELVNVIGEVLTTGAKGHFASGGSVLTDVGQNYPLADVTVGCRLEILGDGGGWYDILSLGLDSLFVTPPFVSDGTDNISYRILQGVPTPEIDPSVIADVVYKDFNPLATEPFDIRILSACGVAGGTLGPVNLAAALQNGRTLYARFGTLGDDFELTTLSPVTLGGIEETLFVPSGAHLVSQSFNLQVGTSLFTQGVNLIPVSSFSPDPGANIEYRTTGALKFGSTVLTNFQGATVQYEPTVLPSAVIASGAGEVDPNTGAISLSSVDVIEHDGETVYFVEQLVPVKDVALNPILGAFTFTTPLSEGQLVFATYTRAVSGTGAKYLVDGEPVVVSEFLPVFIRREVATRVGDHFYSFNPIGRTVDPSVKPQVYAGPNLLTYGVPEGCTINFEASTISLVKSVAVGTKVTISYAVFEAVGGETSYVVSSPPVWRPPFYLPANAQDFTVESDWTGELTPGQLLRIGPFVTYLANITYDAGTNLTTVEITPSPTSGVGTLAPSDASSTLITDRVVTPKFSDGADRGFLPTISDAYGLSGPPHFDPVSVGATSIRFEGDLTKYGVAGHLLELFGTPYILSKTELSSDGRYTTFTVTSPFGIACVWTGSTPASALRISVRPIYPSGATVFLGPGKVLETEPFDLVLYGEEIEGVNQPGRTLTLGKDYTLDANTGTISLVGVGQPGLLAGMSLRLYRTDAASLSPFLFNGAVAYPRVGAAFSYTETPTEANGLLGSVLLATYTFESPDSFYTRVAELATYTVEVATEIAKTSNGSSNGPSITTGESAKSYAQGRSSLVGQRADLVSRDRVCRTYLGFYNGVVSAFEQIEETLSGNMIGERDGKFRFQVGKDNPWTPPGYEDDITGALNPRNLWFEVWSAARAGSTPIPLTISDPVVDPLAVTTDAEGRPSGTYQDPYGFSYLQGQQALRIKNDVDDVALLGRVGVTRSLAGFIYFSVRGFGNYQPLSMPSAFSRLFPERTTTFTTTGPGIGADTTGGVGVYSAGKLSLNPLVPSIDFASTTGTPIGRLENPTLGVVTNVLGVVAKDRLARARVWDYQPSGVGALSVSAADRPTFIATVVPLDRFPTNGVTGLPITTALASQSGGSIPTGLPDLLTGDPTLHTPPFKSGDALALGHPDGSVSAMGYTGTSFGSGSDFRYAGVYVDEVLLGCLITLKSQDGSGNDVAITDPSTLVLLTSPTTGSTFLASQGDTLVVVPNTGAPITVSDPPTATELGTLSAALPNYRTGTDLDFRSRTGELIDATLPSFRDPTLFGLKEILGQKPPAPMSTLEASVSFQNGATLPVEIPALKGEKTLDNGDYSNPYYQVENTELDLLGAVLPATNELLFGDSNPIVPANPATVAPYVLEALYPDEILDNAGVISDSDPVTVATLATAVNLHPSSTVYPSPGRAGVGTLAPYDLVLVQEGAVTPAGSTGILSVGAVTFGATSLIEPPRFVSEANTGSKISLSIENLQTCISSGHTAGVVVTEDTSVPGVVKTSFDFSSIASLVLDNGSGGGVLPTPVGGYNEFMAQCSKNTAVIVKILRNDGHVNPTANVVLRNDAPGSNILTSSYLASGDDDVTTVAVNAGGLRFYPQIISVETLLPFFNFTDYNPTTPGPGITRTGGFHDVCLSIVGVESLTYSIESDRLTVSGPIDTRTASLRGATSPAGEDLACKLSISSQEIELFDPVGGISVVGASDLNAGVNGGTPFTFLGRSTVTPSVYGVGWFSAGVGHLKVMAFEGFGNAPIADTGITFSALPSSRQNATDPIFNGIVICDEAFDPPVASPRIDRFTVQSTITGDDGNVFPGDILVIANRENDPSLPTPIASGKAGTYLIRDTVVANTGVEERRAILTTLAGDGNGWLGLEFPKVVSTTSGGTPTLTVDSIQTLPASVSFTGVPVSASITFPASGRVFVIADPSKLDSPDSTEYAKSVYSAAYSSISGTTFLGLSVFRNGIGAPASSAAFLAAASAGKLVSGMTYAPVSPQGAGFSANLPGHTDPSAMVGDRSFYGFRSLAGSRGGHTISYVAATNGELDSLAPGILSINTKVKQVSTTFLPLTAPVYDDIPGVLDLTQFNWDGIHVIGVFPVAGTRCLLPGDSWSLDYSAQAAIYTEPSFPTTGNDLGGTSVNVVDAANSLSAGAVGARQLRDYLTDLTVIPPGGSLLELAQCEVRRVRRWHGINDTLATVLRKLRFAYEIRRGIVSTVTTVSGRCVLTADPVSSTHIPSPLVGGTATQVGDFTDPDVNVHAGDVVRFLNASGEVIESAEVLSVDGALSMTLSRFGLVIAPATRFEIYLQTPSIPQEQSAEQLLELATDRVVVNRTADYTAQTGGVVTYIPNADPQIAYDQSANRLSDTGGAGVFAEVEAGDMVVVDPAGEVAGPTGAATPIERGQPPYGDDGVSVRPSQYTVGGPVRVDDNRGYYRVASVAGAVVTVSATGNLLAGDRDTGDRVFGTSTGYAVYPTVHGSNLSGTADGIEGQMDLRPTEFAGVGNSFEGTYLSVAPFSYRIIRPSPFLSEETVELILSTRERTLSWIDTFQKIFGSGKGGTYFVFQRDQHLLDLGLTTDSGSGLGVLHNALIQSILGRVDIAPFINGSTCLSALDRRFWGLDMRLDYLKPNGSSVSYTDFAHGIARPVLPDRIETVLNQTDKLRATRFAWLVQRTDRVSGTIESIRRFDAELPNKQAEQDRTLLIAQSTGKLP